MLFNHVDCDGEFHLGTPLYFERVCRWYCKGKRKIWYNCDMNLERNATRETVIDATLAKYIKTSPHRSAFSEQLQKAQLRNSGNFNEHAEDIFKYFREKSPFFQTFSQENLIDNAERQKNIREVNVVQKYLLLKGGQSVPEDIQSDCRYINVYARVFTGKMDPFALVVIAKTVEWYVQSGHALLFNNMRILPDKVEEHQIVIHEQIARMCPEAEFPKLISHEKFRQAIGYGTNTFFPTHSRASEAQQQHSTPIIGRTTANNLKKLKFNRKKIVFRGLFGLEDPYRGGHFLEAIRKPFQGDDVAGNIAGLIDETLRTLRAVERVEISRGEKLLQRAEAYMEELEQKKAAAELQKHEMDSNPGLF